jgi:hypothetical protein
MKQVVSLSMNGRDREFLTTTVTVGIITGLTYMGLMA